MERTPRQVQTTHEEHLRCSHKKNKDTQQQATKCGGRCTLECAWPSHLRVLTSAGPRPAGPSRGWWSQGGPCGVGQASPRGNEVSHRTLLGLHLCQLRCKGTLACMLKGENTHTPVGPVHRRPHRIRETQTTVIPHPTSRHPNQAQGQHQVNSSQTLSCTLGQKLRTLLKQSEPLRRLPVVPLSTTAAPAPTATAPPTTASALAAAAGPCVSVPRPRGTWRGSRASNAACAYGRGYGDTQACRHGDMQVL